MNDPSDTPKLTSQERRRRTLLRRTLALIRALELYIAHMTPGGASRATARQLTRMVSEGVEELASTYESLHPNLACDVAEYARFMAKEIEQGRWSDKDVEAILHRKPWIRKELERRRKKRRPAK